VVQLQVRETVMTEGALVQGMCMFPCACQPGGDGGLSVAEDPFGRGSIQPFSQRGEHHCNLLRGSFQAVEGRVAPASERGTAGLAAKRLDLLGPAMRAISDQSVDVSISVPEVMTLVVGAGEALGVHPSGGLPAGFSPQARDAPAETLALLPTRPWRRDGRRGNRLGSWASGDGGAYCASWQLLSTWQDLDEASKEHKTARERR